MATNTPAVIVLLVPSTEFDLSKNSNKTLVLEKATQNCIVQCRKVVQNARKCYTSRVVT